MQRFWENRLIRFLISGAIAAGLILTLPGCIYGTQYYLFIATIVLLFLIVNLAPFFGRFPIVTHIARIALGGLLIFSGAIKANDPLGFAYKNQEYFEIFGKAFPCNMGSEEQPDGKPVSELPADYDTRESVVKGMWEFFHDHALALSIIICIVEIILGGMILLGIRVKLTLWLILLMMVFFSFLTFYSACCNQVKTCGCFGDFIKLSPWGSFWKDMVLMVLIALLFAGKDNINPVFRPMFTTFFLVIIVGFALWLPWYTYNHLPVFDFRPYQPGTDLCKTRVSIPDDIKWYYTYKNKATGESKEFEQVPDSTWEYVSYRNEVIKPGVPSQIMDFSISSAEGDLTDSLLNMKGYKFFLVSYDLTAADRDEQGQINDFYALAKQDKMPFFCLTASVQEDINKFKSETSAAYPFYFTDATALKTVIRANPGLVLMKDCIVIEMWHNNDFPSYNDVKSKYLK
jgi:uncharacterized membrane protein YphA (DoxX/SURF4 family)